MSNTDFWGVNLPMQVMPAAMPWFIRQDSNIIEGSLIETKSVIALNSFIEYYY